MTDRPRPMTDNNPIERDWEQNDLEAWLESVRDEKSKALEMNDMDGANYASGKETALITALEVIDYIRFELEDLANEWDNTAQYDDVREMSGPQAQIRCAKELERRIERLFNDGDTVRCPNCSGEAKLDWLGDMEGVGIVCDNCDTTVGYGGNL